MMSALSVGSTSEAIDWTAWNAITATTNGRCCYTNLVMKFGAASTFPSTTPRMMSSVSSSRSNAMSSVMPHMVLEKASNRM